jgi:hypothetical protein
LASEGGDQSQSGERRGLAGRDFVRTVDLRRANVSVPTNNPIRYSNNGLGISLVARTAACKQHIEAGGHKTMNSGSPEIKEDIVVGVG